MRAETSGFVAKMIDFFQEEQIMQGDVSFTFLHRVEEVELNIADGRWQSALVLTLPDICGSITFPGMVVSCLNARRTQPVI